MDLSAISYPALLWAAGAATVVIGWFMGRQGRGMTAGGGAGIVAFELARSPAAAAAILERWGAQGRAAAARSLRIDYVWVVAYVAFLGGWLLWTAVEVRATAWAGDDWIRWPGVVAAAGVAVAGVLDWIENTALLRQISDGPTATRAGAAHLAATVKFTLVAVGAALAAIFTSYIWLLSGLSR